MKIIFKNKEKTKSVVCDGTIRKSNITLSGSEYHDYNRLYWENQWLFKELVSFETKTESGNCQLIHSVAGIGGIHNGYHIVFEIE